MNLSIKVLVALVLALFVGLTCVRVFRFRECRTRGFSVFYCASAG